MTTIISVPPATSRFRDMSDAISPTWLNGPVGQRFRYCQAILYDALADASAYAVRSRFPLLAPPDAFGYLASDRQIDRGFAEGQASFANRLIQWLDLWRGAGNATSMLLALIGVFLPVSVKVRTVDQNSNWNTYEVGADPFPITADSPTPATLVPTAGNWSWDSDTTSWWRVWVIIYVSPLGWTTGPLWGTGNWGLPRLWGITGPTSAQIQLIRAIIRKWKPAHANIVNIILSFDDTLFDPTKPAGPPFNPDGTWDNPANRYPGAAYIEGVT